MRSVLIVSRLTHSLLTILFSVLVYWLELKILWDKFDIQFDA